MGNCCLYGPILSIKDKQARKKLFEKVALVLKKLMDERGGGGGGGGERGETPTLFFLLKIF